MSDRAFLRAIVSEPADDTARLVYADWLEETGEPVQVARAEFIRTQIQAHTLHPNDPRRAELQAHAAELFAVNWVEWWSPVCSAIGLPVPQAPTGSFRERVGRFFGREPPRRGHPYRVDNLTTLGVIQPPVPAADHAAGGRVRRLPQWISLLGDLRDTKDAVRAWTNAAPLTALHLHGTVGREWKSIDGEHLHGVRELLLGSAAATAVTAVAQSRNLPRLEELSLRPDRSNIAWPAEQYRAFVDSSLATRVRWLNVVIGRADETEVLHGAHFANLSGLSLSGLPDADDDEATLVAAAAIGLTRSSFLTELKELTLTGTMSLYVGMLVGWLAGQLRRLVVDGLSRSGPFCDLIRRDPFSALTDLTVSTRDGIRVVYAALADSPLAGRLRHLRLTGGQTNRWRTWDELPRLINALDSEKLETLALDPEVRDVPEVWAELQERFPGRVSVV